MIDCKWKGTNAMAAWLAAAVGVLGFAIAGQAGATCMNQGFKQGTSLNTGSGAHFSPATFSEDDSRGFSPRRVGFESHESDDSIVGLWQFKWAGFSVDYGTQAYHSDGTEITFSGGQNPQTGDVCQGVWRKIGPNTYTLNHIAMGWTAPGAGFGLRVHLHFVLKVDPSGEKMTGVYKAFVYSVTPSDPFDESVQLAAGTGTVTATRVLPD
jgi:hypothetical protein